MQGFLVGRKKRVRPGAGRQSRAQYAHPSGWRDALSVLGEKADILEARSRVR